jgi:hypothetical protein
VTSLIHTIGLGENRDGSKQFTTLEITTSRIEVMVRVLPETFIRIPGSVNYLLDTPGGHIL